jgi:hypothetical protein
MKMHKFGSPQSDDVDDMSSTTKQFSPLSSHISDHQRILNIGRLELQAKKQQQNIVTEKDTPLDC